MEAAMDRQIPRRVWVAFLVTPLAAVLALLVCAAVWLIARGESIGTTLKGATHASFFFALFGIPTAYVIEFAVGVPLYIALRERDALVRWRIVTIATALGAVVMPLVWRGFWGGGVEWGSLVIGAVMGVVVGVVFASLAGMRSQSRTTN
jgi:hypothetical protein